MADIVYNKMTHLLATGALNMSTEDIRVLLATTTYAPDKDHDFVNDITNEVSGGSGYVRKALANETVTLDNTNDWTKFTHDPLVWTAANFGTFRYMIYYVHNVADNAAALLKCIDLTSVVTNGGNLTITPHANGSCTIRQG
jgi:hypothetical protein